ncbi:MAG: hypothetical protein JRE19_18515 [Deltaproteobacteria bacterium]|nr:hypothetical protein [Deltaproteobacteria bacterium]
MSDDIQLDINDGVAVITFNRPDAMNTFTTGMMDGLGDAYRRCDVARFVANDSFSIRKAGESSGGGGNRTCFKPPCFA